MVETASEVSWSVFTKESIMDSSSNSLVAEFRKTSWVELRLTFLLFKGLPCCHEVIFRCSLAVLSLHF